MEGISDIRIDGIDNTRPPSAKNSNYIDLFFRLNHKAPAGWCEVFNEIMVKHPSKPKVRENEGLFVETWVKKADQIVEHVELLKKAVIKSSEQYIKKLEDAMKVDAASAADAKVDDSPQGKLNRIIAELDFGEDESK